MVGPHWLFMVTKNSKWKFLTIESCEINSGVRRERDWVLSEFKAGRSPILIATDVASRGLGMYRLLLSTHNISSSVNCRPSILSLSYG